MATNESERRRKLAECAKQQENRVLYRVLMTVAREATDEELGAFDAFVERELARGRGSAEKGPEQ